MTTLARKRPKLETPYTEPAPIFDDFADGMFVELRGDTVRIWFSSDTFIPGSQDYERRVLRKVVMTTASFREGFDATAAALGVRVPAMRR